MNKCRVDFVCTGMYQCDNRILDGSDMSLCRHLVEGYCTCKKAQIQALQDEGFDVKGGEI